jgi:hypothetical protein
MITMPTKLHDSGATWLNNEKTNMNQLGFLTFDDAENIETVVGTSQIPPTIIFFADNRVAIRRMIGVYRNSVKQPDAALRPDGPSLFPTVVVEAGHSESLPRLRSVCILWFVSSECQTQLDPFTLFPSPSP